ncbi:MAG: Ykof family thiamine-binding protein [Deltaproteobacteria bacterium]|nr:Ykof family thiamine-binding protein [Deltaproteobacteria bacterium]
MPDSGRKSHRDYPWTGCGSDKDLAGCRFSLYPLDNRYAKIVLGALAKVDVSKIFSQTDALSTVYRGRLGQVFDCLSALFVHSYRENLHVCLEAQAMLGCPGDDDTDQPPPADDLIVNRKGLLGQDFLVKAKLALYPLGLADYLPIIAEAFDLAKNADLKPKIIHYATMIEGPVLKVFDYLQDVSAMAQGKVSHHALHFTVSVNSPTGK